MINLEGQKHHLLIIVLMRLREEMLQAQLFCNNELLMLLSYIVLMFGSSKTHIRV